MAEDSYFWGTGRRKSAVARVRIRAGNGSFVVNGRECQDYFPRERDQNVVRAPLTATKTFGKYDIFANVNGGGDSGQAGAVVLGIARALLKVEDSMEDPLREGGFLTRDSRMVERKKYGKRGARRGCQFSKR